MARPKIRIDEAEVERMARLGMTQAQIARALGVSTDTFERRKAESETLRMALERGRAKGVDLVAGALFESAMKGNVRAQVFYLKAHAGWSETKHRPFSVPPLGQEKEGPVNDFHAAREELRQKLYRLVQASSQESLCTGAGAENPGDGAARPAEPPHSR
jgi:hypothetical protein